MNLAPIIQSEVSQRKANTVYYCIYMEFRKMVPIILHAGSEGDTGIKNRVLGSV